MFNESRKPITSDLAPYTIRYKVYQHSEPQEVDIYARSHVEAEQYYRDYMGNIDWCFMVEKANRSVWYLPWNNEKGMLATGTLSDRNMLLYKVNW